MLFLRDRLDAICSKHVYRVHVMNLGDAVTIATTVWQINNQAGVVSILTKKTLLCNLVTLKITDIDYVMFKLMAQVLKTTPKTIFE